MNGFSKYQENTIKEYVKKISLKSDFT